MLYLHAVMLEKENKLLAEQVADRITSYYPRCHRVNEYSFLLFSDDISEQIATKLGIASSDLTKRSGGLVFKLTDHYYAGYASPHLWEFLDKGKP